ncbi:MAG: cell division protein FtsZ, partial [Sphingobacteriales bacterium]
IKPLEPVNSFIEPKVEIHSSEPVLKAKEEVKQSDLFGDLFNVNKARRNEEPENIIVKHTLIDEEVPVSNAQIEPGFEFEIKVAETDFVFETPAEVFNNNVGQEQEEVVETGADDDKSDESIEDQLKKSKERILRLKDLSMKLRTSNGLQELENEPAYKRKQMQLQQVQHSSESQVSRFTLSNDDEGGTEIRPNNSFLHDNVD